MTGRFTRLAELSVHGANVQEDQIVLVGAEIGLEAQACATAEAAYKRGAKFVDVAYFDPYVKRVRIENAHPDTLGFAPLWYGERVLEHAEQNGARISLRGVTAPNVMDGLDKSILGKDMLPSVKETFKVISERSTDWCFVPAPHPACATLVNPDVPADDAYEQLWRELEHVLRLDEPGPIPAWDERIAVLNDSVTRLTERRFDAIDLRGPGTELTIGLLPTATCSARAGGRQPTSCMPRPGRRSTSARCRPRALLDVERRGHGSPDARRASSTATPTRATSA